MKGKSPQSSKGKNAAVTKCLLARGVGGTVGLVCPDEPSL